MRSDPAEFYKSILNAIPAPVFVVEEDVRIVDFNEAAAKLLGDQPEMLLRTRAGEALHCFHSTDDPGGCGRASICETCVVRNSVNASLAGKRVIRQSAKFDLQAGNAPPVHLHFLVTSSPFEFEDRSLAMLLLEDISELITLRGLLPICARCKKIRDDGNYWDTVEHFFTAHLDVDFSHGLCPDCIKHLYPDYIPSAKIPLPPAI